jgi:hypothetical protein
MVELRKGIDRTYRKSKALFRSAPPTACPCRRPFSPAALAAPPARRGRPPERPGARRGTVQRGFGWCWTGTAGWGRIGPLGLLEGWGLRLLESGLLLLDGKPGSPALAPYPALFRPSPGHPQGRTKVLLHTGRIFPSRR